MGKNKIGFVFVAKNFGGHEKMTLRIIQLLRDTFEIIAFVNRNNERLISELNQSFLVTSIIKMDLKMNGSFHFSPYFFITDIYRGTRIFKKSQLKSILFIDGGIFASLALNISLKITSSNSKAFIYIPLLPSKKISNLKFKSALFKNYLNLFQKVIVVNDNQKKYYSHYSETDKVIFIPNFLDNSNFEFKSREIDPKGEIKLLFIGRIDEAQKGINRFIQDIYCNLPKNKYHLTVVGDGPDLIKLKKYSSNNSDLNIHFKGWINIHKELFLEHHLLIVPSYYEGDPLVIIESVQNGLNVVSTNTGTFRYIFPQEQIFEIGNPESFDKACKASIKNASSKDFWYDLNNKQKNIRNKNKIKQLWINTLKI